MGQSELKVVITETDQGASDATQDLTNKLKGVTGATQETTSSNQDLGMSMIYLNQGVELAQKAWGALKQVYDATVGTTLQLADQTRTLQNITGASAEQAGVLIAQFQDLGISTDVLRVAFDAAAKKGLQPTVEGLQAMRAEYNAIQDPVAQTKWLMETFGRSGAQLAEYFKTSSASLDQMAQSARDAGVAMSQQGVDGALKYQIALSELNQEFQGLEVNIGGAAIPYLTGLLDVTKKTNEQLQQEAFSWESLFPELKAAETVYLLLTNATDYLNGSVDNTTASIITNILAVNDQRAAHESLYNPLANAKRGIDDLGLADQKATINAGIFGSELSDSKSVLNELRNSAVDPLTASIGDLNQQYLNGALDSDQFTSAMHRQYDIMMNLLAPSQAVIDLYKNYGVGPNPNASPFAGMAGGVGAGASGTYVQPTKPATGTKISKTGNKGGQASGGDYFVTEPTWFLAGEAGPERATFQPSNTNNYNSYNLSIYGASVPANVVQEFAMLKSLTGGGV